VSRARQFLALVLLGIFLYIAGGLFPAFLGNLRLQRYVEALTQSGDISTRSADMIRSQVLQRAGELGLPVQGPDVQIERTTAGARVSIRYIMPVHFPGYTVKLHFSPSAGR
jgi:hypothetical protein